MKSITLTVIIVVILSVTGLAQSTTETNNPVASPTVTSPTTKTNRFQITWLAIDVLPVSPRPSSEYSPEYKWRFGKRFSGGGFAEKGYNRTVTSRHNIQFKPFPKQAPWLAIRQEVAFTSKGYALQTGLQFELTQVPKIKKPLSKVFRSLSVSPMSRWSGKVGSFNETQVAWNTKQFKLGQAKIWLEGFERIRGGKRRDFGQWQTWVSFPKLSEKMARTFGYDKSVQIAFGAEIESRGWKTKHTPMFGFKIFKTFK